MSYRTDIETCDGASPIINQPVPNIINVQPIPATIPPAYYYHQPIEEKRNDFTILDYSKDYAYSVTFLVLGIFLGVPLVFNSLYLRSPNNKARNIAFASLIIASFYITSAIMIIVIFYFLNESYGYYDRYGYYHY